MAEDYTMDQLFKKQQRRIKTPASSSLGHQPNVLAHRKPGAPKPKRRSTPKPKLPKRTSGGIF